MTISLLSPVVLETAITQEVFQTIDLEFSVRYTTYIAALKFKKKEINFSR
jgi:hypothetical protein